MRESLTLQLFAPLLLFVMLLAPAPGIAHTFGSVVQTTTVTPAGQGLRLLLDMRLDAGILVFKPDADNDGELSLDEWNALLARLRKLTAERFTASVNGEPAAVRFEPAGDLVPAAQGIEAGAQVLLEARIPLPPDISEPLRISINDENFAVTGPEDQLNWYLNASLGARDMRLADAFWRLEFTLPPGWSTTATDKASASGTRLQRSESQGTQRLLSHIRETELTPLLLGISLTLAFFLGAAHSLSPGHGKSLVAAYLVGARGRLLDAVKLALIVTASHVGGVVLLGGLLLASSSFIDLRAIHPWLGVASGLLIFLIGYWMVARRALHADAHGHSHEAGHEHETGSLVSLGLVGGMVPCPTAIVVLLAAVAAGRLGFGLLLVLAFSLGLSLVLLAIGVATVTASRRLSMLSGKSELIAKLPVFSAGLVMLAGALIALNALQQAGILVLRWP